MSEVKRASLISFGSRRVNDKNSKDIKKTIRISVILPESTEDKCPEFNYKDELVAYKKKCEIMKNPNPKQQNGLDPFNDDDEDVKRIAAEMEVKYGMGVSKKRKWRKDDYADIGMGYDESDSFIDNTDGYDEIIPKNVTTVHGGFYINCGALEFKTDEDMSTEKSSSSDEDEDDETTEKISSRKRVLESSAESEEDANTDNADKVENVEKKQKLITNPNGMQKALKKRLFNHDKIKQFRKKRTEETKKTVRELLNERRHDLNMSIIPDTPEKQEPVAAPKENKKPAPSVVDNVIETVINSGAKKKEEPTDESSKDSSSSKDAVNHKSIGNSSEAESNDGTSIKSTEIVQLPENLLPDIISIIDSIKQAAASSTEGKVKFFSGNVNVMLLNLERKCRCLGKQSRMKVYEHLAPFVKCRKETLIKRAKNLCIVEEQKKINTLINRLKTTVESMIPTIIKNYEEECKSLQKKLTPNDETAKSLRIPKRHFTWPEELKKLLREIIILRRKCYLNEGKQKESLEKHLIDFIKSEIQCIWPDGWMSMSTLIKYCNLVPDVKKPVDSSKKPVDNSKKPVDNSKKPVDSSKKPTSTEMNISSANISISPASSISLTSSVSMPVSVSSALTITPVVPKPPITTNIIKTNSSDIKKIKPPVTISEMVISKVNSDNSVSKPNKALPPIEIIKTKSPELSNIKYNPSVTNSNKRVELDSVVIEDIPVKIEEPENLSSHANIVKPEPTREQVLTNHCQIIDLTDQPELKKRPGPKSKTKYLYEYPDKMPKLKKEQQDHSRLKPTEEITGSSALTQIIADSLSDINRYNQNNVIPKSTVINSIPSTSTSDSTSVKKLCGSYDYSKTKSTSEGDDIQKVMEGLKALQKLSSPAKLNEESKTSSPVSVIAFNKSYSQEAHASTVVNHRTNSFQDAFQKQFIPDYNNFMKASQSMSTPKGNYNSTTKHNHTSSKSSSSNSEKYIQNSNNNYPQQNCSKSKITYPSSQQSGSYDMLDDMFTNFLNEHGHTKSVNSKTSTSHK